jgi:hypothetical protein
LVPSHHQFKAAVSSWRDDKLLPYITPQEKLVPVGTGDGKIQSYGFRLCLTKETQNRLPITKPDGYNPARYELLRRYIAALAKSSHDQELSLLSFGPLPNGKYDANSYGPVSSNLPGANQDYPEGSSERRKQIRDEHLQWVHGLLYFMQNDPSVPPKTRDSYARWGLCRDEFQDNGGWPHQLYVREARRLLGEYVLTQSDLQTQRRKEDSIGMAGYNIDIREVQWVSVRNFHFPKAEDEVFLEGYLSQPVEPWEIPYRSLLPRQSECTNLLVPVCISASTVAYSSFRMEPNYMIAGHSAGVAAALAVKTSTSVQQIDLKELQEMLTADGQVLHHQK